MKRKVHPDGDIQVVMKHTRVANAVRTMIKKFDNPESIHELMIAVKNNKHPITNYFAIHEKDSKSSNREIPV
jgi:ribosomal protein L31